MEYSKARPQQLTRYVVSTGADEYSLTSLISGWNPVLHTLHNIRVNVGEASEYNADARDWTVVQKADGTHWIRFRQFAPTGTIGLEYYAPHVLTSSSCTIFAPDEHPFAHLAASYVLQTAANKTAENASSTITADAVSQGEQSKAYAFQSKDEFAKWEAHLVAVRSNASSVRLNWDLERTAHNGYGRFWNRRGRLGL